MKRNMERIAITGVGLELPGWETGAAGLCAEDATWNRSEFRPEDKLGKKGLLYKDRSTKLALCAAKSALEDARLSVVPAGQADPESFGVVVSSNFGNLDTVCRVVETIRAKGVAETSSMDLPNASSNVIATTLSIRFGLKSLNLMVCNGSTSGIDALYLAANAIRAGRAKRMLVVGVETDNLVVGRLLADSGEERGSGPILDGAGAVVLESAEAARERGLDPAAFLGSYFHGGLEEGLPEGAAAWKGTQSPMAWFTPNRSLQPASAWVEGELERWPSGARPRAIDISSRLGECYGALGVIQCVAAACFVRTERLPACVTSGGTWGDDTLASLQIHTLAF